MLLVIMVCQNNSLYSISRIWYGNQCIWRLRVYMVYLNESLIYKGVTAFIGLILN